MSKPLPKINTSSLDELFSTEDERQEENKERVERIPITKIKDFNNHPYHVRTDEDMIHLVESIKENGQLVPVLVRPTTDGFEMISGHRRKYALELIGQNEVHAIVRNLTDEQATILMVDSNIQREHILPSERGFAYKMKLEAMKHQGKRTDLTCGQLGHKLNGKKSIQILAEDVGDSFKQIQRYIRLTELIEPLRVLVDGLSEDGKKIALNPAVELSFLNKEQQQDVYKFIQELDATPSYAQTMRMKELAKSNRLDENVIYTIMTEEKANQKDKLSFKMDQVDKYFPKSYTPRQKQETILRLLDQWAKHRSERKESR